LNDSFAVGQDHEVKELGFVKVFLADAHPDRTDRLFGATAGRAGDSSDAQSDIGAGALANATASLRSRVKVAMPQRRGG